MTGVYRSQGAPSRRAHLEKELLALAQEAGASSNDLVELAPRDTVRTFHVGETVVRTDMDPDGLSLRAEAVALVTLKDALREEPVTPEVTLADVRDILDEERPVLVYPWVDGHTLHEANVGKHLDDVAHLLARMHSVPVLDLKGRFPVEQPWPLLTAYKQASDALKAWTQLREGEGIGADLLTLTLSDLQRNLRRYVLAQDRLFLVRRRPCLCHGRASVDSFVHTDAGLVLVNFDKACLGDAATDLARFSIDAGLSDVDEQRFLQTYLDAIAELGAAAPHFIPRFYARKTVLFLQIPAERIRRMMGVKSGDVRVLDDPIVTLERELSLTTSELTRGLNGLLPLIGNRRRLSRREVEGMGRIIGFEDLLLTGRTFHIALSGEAYSGKTEVGSALSRRLAHAFVNTTALSRALALVERQALDDGTPKNTRALIRELFDSGFHLQARSEPPFYAAFMGTENITDQLRQDTDRVRAAALLDDEPVRRMLRDALVEHHVGAGMVVEGPFAPSLLPAGAKEFHLTCDASVRRARLRDHREGVDSDDEADAMLARLDEGLTPAEKKLQARATALDAKAMPATAVALQVLQHLLPPGRRSQLASTTDLSGRPPLFSR